MKKSSHITSLNDNCDVLINLYLAELQGKAKVNTIPDYNAVVRLFEHYRNKITFDPNVINKYMTFKVPCNQDVRCGQYATFAEFSIIEGNDGVYVRFTRERANKNNNCLTSKHRMWL